MTCRQALQVNGSPLPKSQIRRQLSCFGSGPIQ
jgi:hypothetical protein